MLSHAHDNIIDRGDGAPGHEKYVMGGLNATDKSYLSMSMATIQLPNTATKNTKW